MKDFWREEVFAPANLRRSLVGAVYGFLGGTVFALAAAWVDILLFPSIPMRVDVSYLLTLWLWCGFGLALAGAVAANSSENLVGIGTGSLTLSLLALVAGLVQSRSTGLANFLLILFLALPVAASTIPLAWFLRWIVLRYESFSMPKLWLSRLFLILLVTAVAIIPAFFLRMNSQTVQAVTFVDELIRDAVSDMPQEENQVAVLPNFAAHKSMSYGFNYQPSITSTVGVDVQATFEDQYQITCVAVLYPGAKPYIRSCTEGPFSKRP